MKNTFDQGACVYGAAILRKHLDALEREIPGVRENSHDIEHIHRMRVASRRLRAAMPLFEVCLPSKKAAIWLKEVRKITRALGAARDADVQMDVIKKYLNSLDDQSLRTGPTRLLLRLRQQRQNLQPPVEAALEALQTSDFISGMTETLQPLQDQGETVYQFTPALYQHAFYHVQQRLNEFLAYNEIVFHPEKVTELHAMRISAKGLRYTIENFSALYSGELKLWLNAVREAQDALGAIHDCDIWISALPIFLQEERLRIVNYCGHAGPYSRLVPGIQHFLTDRQEERDRQYRQFVNKWEGWQSSSLWTDLHKTIQAPVFNPAQVFTRPNE